MGVFRVVGSIAQSSCLVFSKARFDFELQLRKEGDTMAVEIALTLSPSGVAGHGILNAGSEARNADVGQNTMGFVDAARQRVVWQPCTSNDNSKMDENERVTDGMEASI